MTEPTLGPVGVVHITLRVGSPTTSQVKVRGIPWETAVDGTAVMFNTIGAAAGDVWRKSEREKEAKRGERGGKGLGAGRGGGSCFYMNKHNDTYILAIQTQS